MISGTKPLNQNLNFLHPNLEDVLRFHADNLMVILSVHHFGTIQKFNPTNQTANVTVDYLKVSYVINGQTGTVIQKTYPYPPLVGRPVRFLHSNSGGVTIPVNAGDKCEIEFNDRDADAWMLGITGQARPTPRLHDFSDAVIVVGIRPPASPIQNFDNTKPMLRTGDGNTYVAVDPSNGKIQLKNSAQNVATVLQSILTHLQELTTTTGSISPTSAAQFAADAVNLGAILE